MTRADRRALALLVGVFSLAYSLSGVLRHWRFGTSYDLGIFDQAVWHLSRFERPGSTISGFSNVLGDHFYPVIALWAPFYWVLPAPETLIVLQALLFAASTVPVFAFVRSRLSRGAAYTLTVAYALFWGLQRAAAADVHEIAFAPLVIAIAVLALDRRRWPLFWAMAVALVGIKEDLIPLLGGFGVLLLIQGERRHGVVLAAASLILFIVVVGLVIPAFSDAGWSAYTSPYLALLERPWTLPVALVTPSVKIETMALWLAPFLFLPLGSPYGLLMVPIAITRLLSDSPHHWGTSFHYSAPLAPLLAMSAADALARIARRLQARGAPAHRAGRVVAAAVWLSLVLSAFLPGHQPLWRLFSPRHYRVLVTGSAAAGALAAIPNTASVLAQAAVVPHLSQRAHIYVLGRPAPDTDYVIAAADLSPWPAPDFDGLRQVLQEKERRGYTVVFQRDGWMVLQRSPAGSIRP